VLDDDALEQLRRNSRIPDTFGIDDDDRSAGAYTKTGSLTTFYPRGSEEQSFPLEQRREM